MSETDQDGRRDRDHEIDDSPERVHVTDLEAALADSDAPRDDHDGVFADVDDAVVARLGEPDDAPDPELAPPRRRARSPLISLLVLGFAGYLLAAMWSDFRYALRSDDPIELGHAAELVASGGLTGDLHDQYVVLEGTPDVKNAAVGTTKTNLVGYVRITEGGGRLFAAIPRDKDQKVTNNFEGRFVGRMRKLSEDRAYAWLAQFYDTEKVTIPVDVEVASLRDALGTAAGERAIEVQSEQGPATLGPDQEIRLVVAQPDARVQLGKSSFKTPEIADAAIAALGLPWIRLEPTGTFHRYAVRIPEGDAAAIQARLVADLPEGERDPGADPRVGALVVPRTATYVTELGDLMVDGETFVLPYEGNTTSPGYQVADGKLVERTLPDGVLRLAVHAVQAIRIERRVAVDPDGFVIAVGQAPASERTSMILWLVVLGIALANVASLWIWWRKRTSA